MLVRGQGMRVATAARQLGLKPRHAQEFMAQEKLWMRDWWDEHYDEVNDYFNGFNSVTKDDRKVGCLLDNPYKMSLSDLQSSGIILPRQFEAKPEVYKVDKIGDNRRVLILSDIHFPYQHKDLFKFLQHLKDKYSPTRVICMGDEMDHHALSFHDSDPDLPSAGDELRRALPFVQELYRMFPEMDILDSNHGSLVYRKAKHHGVPKHYIKSYNDVLGVGNGWKWSYDLTIDLPNGTKCYFHHGKSPDVVKLSQVMGMSAVQGHYHSVFKVDYWANPNGLYFGMQTGCLVDRDAYAFAYENCNLKKPIIGTGLIIDSHPILEPLIMDEYGNWIGK